MGFRSVFSLERRNLKSSKKGNVGDGGRTHHRLFSLNSSLKKSCETSNSKDGRDVIGLFGGASSLSTFEGTTSDASLCLTLRMALPSATTSTTSTASASENHSTHQEIVPRGRLKVTTQTESLSRRWKEKDEQISSLAENSEGRRGETRSIRFDSVAIHHHAIQLGDNPSVSMGPPVCLEWNPFETIVMPVARFEQVRSNPPRGARLLLMPKRIRESMLIDAGYSRSEMTTAARNAQHIKMSRRQSAKDGQFKELILGILNTLNRRSLSSSSSTASTESTDYII